MDDRSDLPPPVPPVIPAGPLSTRRLFLAALMASGTALAVGGCATPDRSSRRAGMPGPIWPPDAPAGEEAALAAPSESAAPAAGDFGSVLTRGQWARERPVSSLMRPMRPVRFITVHHTAGPIMQSSDRSGTIERLESIRRYHRTLGWGDIGYHFAVDRGGRVWECRPLRWQGAHVKDFNEGNLAVVALGNFDEQQPSEAQIAGITSYVRALMKTYGVPASRLRTHQEWAPTACPGRALQRYMVSARSGGAFG